MKPLFALAAVTLCAAAHAQPTVAWSTLPGGVAISTDAAENVFTVTWESGPGGDILLTKRNLAGTELYTVRYDNTDPTRHEAATWVQADATGAVYVTGTIRSGTSNPVDVNGVLMRFAPDGTLLWRRVLGPDFDGGRAVRVVVDAANNAYVLGLGATSAGQRTTLRKFTPAGTEAWLWADPQGIGAPVNLKLGANGDLLVSTFGVTGQNAGFARIGADGVTVWTRTTNQALSAGDIAGDATGASYIVYVDSLTLQGRLEKVGASGFSPWQRSDAVNFNRVEVGADGEPVASGYHTAVPFGLGLVKYGADGTLRWANRDADGAQNSLLTPGMLKLDPLGNGYVTGTNLSQIGVTRVNADGSLGWTVFVPFGTGAGLALGQQGRVYVTGGQTARIDPQAAPPVADVAVTVTDSPDPVRVGANLVLTTTVRNVGTASATAVVLNQNFTLPVAGVGFTTTQGSCNGVQPLVCSLGTLAPGASVKVVQTVRPRSAGQLTTSAVLTTSSADPVSTNNTATATTTVRRR